MKKTILTTFIVALTATLPAYACTSLLVGKKASADGSTMVTYAADSHILYGELYHQPAADHPEGSMREVREWDSNKYLGKIPEVAHTYNTVGNMNEHQLTIAESTWGGREELVDTTGIIDYGSLIYITLQRAKTAREAIKIMTDLVAEYGYYSSGESFSIADPNEIWIMEMIGKGPGRKGAVWVARRIPDDCIAGHANFARIHTFPQDDPENCIFSDDVISFAKEKGYYEGPDKDFSFSAAYCPPDFGDLRGCDARVWAFYNKHAKGMDEYLPWLNMEKGAKILPLYIKPDQPVKLNDMKWIMRDHFEGTPFDMTQDIGAGPWKLPYRFRPLTFVVDGKEYTHERAIATQQTGFSFVSQMRSYLPDMIGGVLWFGVDDANTAPYIPMYCSMTEIPHSYAVGTGDMLTLSWDAAFWVNNFVANQAYGRYSQMIPDIRKVQEGIESTLEKNQDTIEKEAYITYKKNPSKAAKMLNDYSISQAEDATKKYRKLGEFLLVKYLDGNMHPETDGKFHRTPEGYPENQKYPGYDEKYYRSIVNDAGERLIVIKPEN